MPRQPITRERLFELLNNQHNQGGIAEMQTKGFTEEEESQEIKKMFEYVWSCGYEYIHTLKIIPEDEGRAPYYVHIDNLERK